MAVPALASGKTATASSPDGALTTPAPPQHRLQWFRHEAETRREEDRELYMSLMNRVKQQMEDGTAQPSMATFGLEKQAEFGLSDLEMAYTLSGPWDAGVGTVRSRARLLFAMLADHPRARRWPLSKFSSVRALVTSHPLLGAGPDTPCNIYSCDAALSRRHEEGARRGG